MTAKPYGKCSRATSPVCLVYSVWSIWFVLFIWLIWFIWLVFVQPKTRQTSKLFSILLVSHPSGELRKQLPREVAGIGWVEDILAAKIVVEDSAIGGFVDVGQGEIHAVAFDGAGHATDEDHGAIRLLPLDYPDVRQWVVHLAISVVVPCIVEEDEVAGADNRSLVECALLPYVRMDEANAVGTRVAGFTAIEIDPVFEKNRARSPRRSHRRCVGRCSQSFWSPRVWPLSARSRSGSARARRIDNRGALPVPMREGVSTGGVVQPTSVTIAIVAMMKRNRIGLTVR